MNSLLPDSGNSAPEKIDSALNKERNYFQESTAGNENYLTGYGAPSGTATNTDNANQAFNVGYGEEYNYVANSQSATSLLTNQNPANPSQLQCWTCQSENWLDCMESGKLAFCEPNITSCQVETRKRDGLYASVSTGCKASIACEQDKNNNFVGGWDEPISTNQCRPDYPSGPSVCRQCCYSNNCNFNLDFMDQLGWEQTLN